MPDLDAVFDKVNESSVTTCVFRRWEETDSNRVDAGLQVANRREYGGCLLYTSRLHRRGTRILFDPSPLAGDIAPALRKRILAISDVLTPSEKELDALGGHEGGERLVQAGKTVVWKQGARGGVVQAPRERFSYEAEPCLSVDTTGAGDSFSGALPVSYTHLPCYNREQKEIAWPPRDLGPTAKAKE